LLYLKLVGVVEEEHEVKCYNGFDVLVMPYTIGGASIIA